VLLVFRSVTKSRHGDAVRLQSRGLFISSARFVSQHSWGWTSGNCCLPLRKKKKSWNTCAEEPDKPKGGFFLRHWQLNNANHRSGCLLIDSASPLLWLCLIWEKKVNEEHVGCYADPCTSAYWRRHFLFQPVPFMLNQANSLQLHKQVSCRCLRARVQILYYRGYLLSCARDEWNTLVLIARRRQLDEHLNKGRLMIIYALYRPITFKKTYKLYKKINECIK
jgi:hypothetical protein